MLLVAGCSTIQGDAEDHAAGFADRVLPEMLEKTIAASGATTPEARVEAARQYLMVRDPKRLQNNSEIEWVVRGAEGTEVRVDTYAYLESGSFFPPDQGDSSWGWVCRSYDVGTAVATTKLDCPDETPENPWATA